MDKLKTYKLVLSDDIDNSTGVSVISLVQEPAIEEGFVFFSKDVKFAIQEDRRIVTGPVLIPNRKVYRSIPQPHYVVIDKPGIEAVVKKFSKTKRSDNVNMEHSGPLLNGVYSFESFIADKSRGINPPDQFKDLPDGTWFLSYQIESDELWQSVKDGTFTGFSIEGYFEHVPVQMAAQKPEILQYLDFFKEL
jgi:hypothetical protein